MSSIWLSGPKRALRGIRKHPRLATILLLLELASSTVIGTMSLSYRQEASRAFGDPGFPWGQMIIAPILGIILAVWWYRVFAGGPDRTENGFDNSAHTGAGVVTGLLFMLIGAVFYAAYFIAAITGFAGLLSSLSILWLAQLALVVAALYLYLRLSPAIALSTIAGSLEVARTWAHTRRQLIPLLKAHTSLLGIAFLCIVSWLVLSLIVRFDNGYTSMWAISSGGTLYFDTLHAVVCALVTGAVWLPARLAQLSIHSEFADRFFAAEETGAVETAG